MKFKKIKCNKAVSEILGSMLLLGISVTLFSGAYVSLFSTGVKDVSPHVDIMASIKDNKLVFDHRGGDDITSEAYAILTNESDNSTSIVIGEGDYLEDSNNNNQWNIGERVVIDLDVFSTSYDLDFIFDQYEDLSICIVDSESHSTILTGTVTEEGGSP